MHQALQAKKLVLVLATSTSMSGTKKAHKVRVLDRILGICYPVQFQKDKSKDVLALLNCKNKVNIITPAYTAQLRLKVRKTNVGA